MELLRKIDRKLLARVLMCSFVVGMICHGYRFFNGSFSHDSLVQLYYGQYYSLMIFVGRFLRPIYSWIKGDVALPLINGVLGIFFLGLTSYFTIEILNIKNKLLQLIICGIIICNPSISLLNATYIHDTDCYCLALFLAVFSVYLMLKDRKALSCILLVSSLGLYQAYIQVAIIIFVTIAFIDILHNQNCKQVLFKLFERLLYVGLSMIAYFVIYKLVVLVTNVDAVSYNSVSNVNIFNIDAIIDGILSLLNSELEWLLGINSNKPTIVFLINMACLFILLIVTIRQSIKNSFRISSYLSICLLAFIGVFGIGCIIFLMGSYHILMMYAYYYVYFMFVAVFQEFCDKRTFICVCGLLTVFIYDCALFSNKAYLRKELDSMSTLSFMSRVVDRMEMTDGYVSGETIVVFIGNLNNRKNAIHKDGFNYDSLGMQDGFLITYGGTYEEYFEYYLSYPIIVDNGKIYELSKNPVVKGMGVFPAEDSVRMIEGVMVVKLSDY